MFEMISIMEDYPGGIGSSNIFVGLNSNANASVPAPFLRLQMTLDRYIRVPRHRLFRNRLPASPEVI